MAKASPSIVTAAVGAVRQIFPSFAFKISSRMSFPGITRCAAPWFRGSFGIRYHWSWTNYLFQDPVLNVPKSTTSPEAYQYCALIKQQLGFTRILTINGAQPGDILSWWEVGKSSGDHTMIIESINGSKPYLNGYQNSNPALAGTTLYEVTVIDSSSGVHTSDSRMVLVNQVSTQIPGIGRGIIGLLVNANAQIIGHTWTLPTANSATSPNTWTGQLNTRLKLAPTWEAVIGRKL